MLKKMFVLFAVVVGVTTMAATDFKKVDLSTLNAEKVALIKSDLENAKIGPGVISCAIAIAKFEANRDLTLVEMENVTKKYCKKTSSQVGAVIEYVRRMKEFDKYMVEMTKDERYRNHWQLGYSVVSGKAKADNVNDYCFLVIGGANRTNIVLMATDTLLENCKKMSEENAVTDLKKAYRTLLPRLVDYPDFKPAATKLGLVLRSYGVEVK